MEFNKQYFINKFTNLTNEEVGSSTLENHCALWHCGVRVGVTDGVRDYVPTDESTALIKLFGGNDEKHFNRIFRVNDATGEYYTKEYDELQPRERILKRLSEVV